MDRSSSGQEEEGGGGGSGGVTYLRGHSAAVYGLDYSPDSDLIFSASGDGCAHCCMMGRDGSRDIAQNTGFYW